MAVEGLAGSREEACLSSKAGPGVASPPLLFSEPPASSALRVPSPTTPLSFKEAFQGSVVPPKGEVMEIHQTTKSWSDLRAAKMQIRTRKSTEIPSSVRVKVGQLSFDISIFCEDSPLTSEDTDGKGTQLSLEPDKEDGILDAVVCGLQNQEDWMPQAFHSCHRSEGHVALASQHVSQNHLSSTIHTPLPSLASIEKTFENNLEGSVYMPDLLLIDLQPPVFMRQSEGTISCKGGLRVVEAIQFKSVHSVSWSMPSSLDNLFCCWHGESRGAL
ncbi:uncharacterized protein LOC131249415 [Magnolia sinica]|uniref:uncharacterized protein LOC131249415 n=1 Tax=Magnolia sinica TaxID=86752 RepID=UPI002659EED6|nr:uncharacterized protein LOC131249415 [Magnolia sinica]